MDNVSVLIVGVGGQGTLLTSKIIGHLAKESGYDVKVSEVHGMSQRGGSVVTYVKYGKQVHSPLIQEGEADILIAFETLEALRWGSYLKDGGAFIVSNQRIDPMPVIAGKMKYPENAIELIVRDFPDAIILDALSIATKCGNKKSINIVLLGVVAAIGEFEKEKWTDAIRKITPARFLDTNLKAFDEGYAAMKDKR